MTAPPRTPRSRERPVQLLDPLREQLRVAELLLDVLLERLLDLLRADSVGFTELAM